jgi:hypothetical protein
MTTECTEFAPKPSGANVSLPPGAPNANEVLALDEELAPDLKAAGVQVLKTPESDQSTRRVLKKKPARSIAELQQDLDRGPRRASSSRPRQDRWCCGKAHADLHCSPAFVRYRHREDRANNFAQSQLAPLGEAYQNESKLLKRVRPKPNAAATGECGIFEKGTQRSAVSRCKQRRRLCRRARTQKNWTVRQVSSRDLTISVPADPC